MSTSFTPSRDLFLKARLSESPSPFTTFASGHFVKPGEFTQPVKATQVASEREASDSEIGLSNSFSGCFTEMFVSAALDLDYDEPNAVVEAELELVQAGRSVHQMELPVMSGLATNEQAANDRVVKRSKQSAA